jgi:hypothetical protein
MIGFIEVHLPMGEKEALFHGPVMLLSDAGFVNPFLGTAFPNAAPARSTFRIDFTGIIK